MNTMRLIGTTTTKTLNKRKLKDRDYIKVFWFYIFLLI